MLVKVAACKFQPFPRVTLRCSFFRKCYNFLKYFILNII